MIIGLDRPKFSLAIQLATDILACSSEGSDLLYALERSGQRSIETAGEMIVRRELRIQPTITVRPGWPLRIIVHKDLFLELYEG
jgi:type IV secretory pathway VirB10-like protein